MKRVFIYLAVAIVISLFWFLYLKKQEVVINEVDNIELPAYTLVGKSFNGRANNDSIQILMQEVANLAKEQNARLEVHYFGDPDQFEQPIELFIGTPINNSSLSSGWKLRSMETKNVLSVRARTDLLIKPNPKDMNEQLKAKAEELGLAHARHYIERYDSDTTVTAILVLN